jgi:hypothetical protein
MAKKQNSNEKTIYHIRVKGNLDEKWVDWFDSFVMTSRGNGETLLSGPSVDQAALHGVLDKIHSLGLQLLLVMRTECPCNSKNCLRHGQCQECLAYHEARGELPFCFKEKTRWDKQYSKIR